MNRINKKCFLLAVLWALLLQTMTMPRTASARNIGREAGQEASVDPTGQGDGYSSVLYDNTNGLPTSEANAIAETSEGFIWIGSYSGLIRYDGNTFERMDSSDGITSVVSLYVDSKDRLWVGTNDSGAAVMQNGTFQIYNKSAGLPTLSVRCIAEDKKGNIYLGTTEGIAVVDENMELHTLDILSNSGEYICELKVGNDDTIYGVTKDGTLFSIKDQELTGYLDAKALGIPNVYSIFPDSQHPDCLYLGTMGSELYYGEMKDGFQIQKKIDTGELSFINSIHTMEDMLWLCTDSGLGFIYEGKLTVVTNIPMTTSIQDMMVDYQGNLWFVSSQQGIMKIVQNQFSDIFQKAKLPESVVNTTCMYDGMLFVGTRSDGLLVLKDSVLVDSIPIETCVSASGKKFQEKDLISMFRDCRIRSILRDSKDRLWLCSFDSHGLVCYDHGKVTKYTSADGLPSERVRVVYECQDGSFMVGCTGGVAVIKDDAIIRVYGEADGIKNIEILTASQMDNGDMVIGTDGGGIYIINEKGISHIGVEDGLSSDVVMRIKKDISKDISWLITSNAIGYMTSDYQIHMIKKFPYSNNFDLYENSKGEMWVLSSNGIYVVTVEELMKNKEILPLFYGRDNGLPCITTSNSYSELTSDGDLYIAGTTGVAKVNIEKLFESVENIKMDVPFIKADGAIIYPDDSGRFTVSSSTKKLTIYSYVYNYSLMNPEVTYHLEGFEEHDTTVKRTELVPVLYTNLKGQDYHFIMQIMDPQRESSKEISVLIVKKKAFYELFWVRIIFVVCILLLLCVLVQFYLGTKTRRFLKKEKEQKQLIRGIVEAFANIIDMKDKYTNGHSFRVAEYTAMLTKELGYDDDTVEQYYNIALLHDIGKVGIPPEVLNKPEKLTEEEFGIIKSHTTLGYETLKNIIIMPELATGAGYHHERPDGKGYPNGLKGSDIPRVAQVIAVADTFDAMYSSRPYRKRMNFEKVVSIIQGGRGTQLEADVVDAFLRLVAKGKFRAPDDDGGGTMENIENIQA